MQFTEQDLQTLAARGISVQQAEQQLKSLKEGFPELNIRRAAAVGDGIYVPTDDEKEVYRAVWADYRQEHKTLKFTPASGAASRMFKALYEFVETGEMTPFIEKFFAHLDEFAFAEELKAYGETDPQKIVETLLEKMNYGHLPKGLLKFHQYDNQILTPAAEHIREARAYATDAEGKAHLHFTVSHEHLPLFEAHIQSLLQGDDKMDVTFSEQMPSTDTLASTQEGEPFRDKEGKLLFRPGGHGALIHNLNEQDADIIFLKNIDNVTANAEYFAETVAYKEILAGILVSLQAQIFAYLKELEQPVAAERLEEMKTFIEQKLYTTLPNNQELTEAIRSILNRPLRVCGMVKNTGEPGGGPFMVEAENGSIQGQILESSQISDKSLMQTATHFNPVDLVCATKDYKGKKFNLLEYTDPKTAFISEKSKDGKPLKALELPGLWNGAMANWTTVFVEVPLATFNPVKTVNDLLLPAHKG